MPSKTVPARSSTQAASKYVWWTVSIRIINAACIPAVHSYRFPDSKNSPTYPDKWNWTDEQNLSTQILMLYFSIHAIKIVWVVQSTHWPQAKWSPSGMPQTFSWKLNLCCDTKDYYYKHIIKVVLQQTFPDYTNFARQKKFPNFPGLFVFSLTLSWPLWNSPTLPGFWLFQKKW